MMHHKEKAKLIRAMAASTGNRAAVVGWTKRVSDPRKLRALVKRLYDHPDNVRFQAVMRP